MPVSEGAIVGVLLAAGRGTRFDASGRESKLQAAAPVGPQAGAPIAVAAARTLRSAVPQVIAVVRPDDSEQQHRLHALLRVEGCQLAINLHADDGMGSSIAVGVAAAPDAAGRLIALADMPAVAATTVQAVRDAIVGGALTAVPIHAGRRGHPVSFAAVLRTSLIALHGDEGARSVLAAHPPRCLAVQGAGCLLDLDYPLTSRRHRRNAACACWRVRDSSTMGRGNA